MRSTILSCLLVLSLKKCMLCCLLVCGGHRCEFLVREVVSNVKFVNMLKIAQKHPQVYWNHYPFLTKGLNLGLWILSLGCLLVHMVAMPFLPVLIV